MVENSGLKKQCIKKLAEETNSTLDIHEIKTKKFYDSLYLDTNTNELSIIVLTELNSFETYPDINVKNFVVTSINIKDIGKYDIIDKSSIIPVVKMKK